MATPIARLEAELAELIARFEALADANEVTVIDTGERWELIEPPELVRVRRRIADLTRRIDAERVAGSPD